MNLLRPSYVAMLVAQSWYNLLAFPRRNDTASCSIYIGTDMIELVGTDGCSLQVLSPSETSSDALNLDEGKVVDIVLKENIRFDVAFDVSPDRRDKMICAIEEEIAFNCPFDLDEAEWYWQANETSCGWRIEGSIILGRDLVEVRSKLAKRNVLVGSMRREECPIWNVRPNWPSLVAKRAKLPWFAWPSIAACLAFAVSAGIDVGINSLRYSELGTQFEGAHTVFAQNQRSNKISSIVDTKIEASKRLLNLLDATAEALPDGNWIEQFTVRGDRVELLGYGPSSTEVLQLLGQIPELTDLRLSSPVLMNANAGIERFGIDARLALEDSE